MQQMQLVRISTERRGPTKRKREEKNKEEEHQTPENEKRSTRDKNNKHSNLEPAKNVYASQQQKKTAAFCILLPPEKT